MTENRPLHCGLSLRSLSGHRRSRWLGSQKFSAYRDLGLGRVWLVESDWGDNGPSWTPESATLLAYMMTNGRGDGDLFEFEGTRNVATPD